MGDQLLRWSVFFIAVLFSFMVAAYHLLNEAQKAILPWVRYRRGYAVAALAVLLGAVLLGCGNPENWKGYCNFYECFPKKEEGP